MMKNMLNSAMKSGVNMNYFHCYILNSNANEASYNTTEFKKLTTKKLEVILMNMQYGEPVLWIDNDIVFFKNCIGDILKYTGTFVMQDDLWGYCTGFFLVRPSMFAKSLIQKCIDQLNSNTQSLENDQHIFNKLCGSIPAISLTKLPQEEYPNGHIYSQLVNKSSACMMHNNYMLNTTLKVDKFKSYGLWDPSDNGFNLVKRYSF